MIMDNHFDNNKYATECRIGYNELNHWYLTNTKIAHWY